MKVTIVSQWAKNYSEIADVTIPNTLEYCSKHGYDFRSILLEDGNAYHYKKHEFFKELFETDVELVWYMDVDCLVTNHHLKIEDFIDETHDFFITRDLLELNGGSLILKNSDGGRWVNNMVLAHREKYGNEQNVYNSHVDTMLIGRFMKVLPHPSINSYRYDIYPEFPNIREREQGHWQPGDFVLHVPAAPMQVRIETLKNTKITK